jgi:cytoskeleton protein RodZ
MSEHEAAPERAPLGSALRAAREARGLAVADIAHAVNLRETVVRAIEADDFSLCGGDVYARGHLRAYARQVGLDEQPLLEAYAERHGTGTASRPGAAAPATQRRPAPVAPLRGRKRADDVPLERTGPNWPLLAGAALALVVVFLLAQLVSDLRAPGRATSEVAAPVTTSSATPSAPAATPRPTTTVSATSGSATGTPPGGSPSSTAPAVDGVAVALRVTGDSWVSVRDAAGRTVFSGLLSKGDARRFTDGKGLRLTLGNAGAVQLTVNGKPLGSAGGNGEVVRLQFGPGDPA